MPEAEAGPAETEMGLPLGDSQVAAMRIKLDMSPFYPQHSVAIIWSERIHSELAQSWKPLLSRATIRSVSTTPKQTLSVGFDNLYNFPQCYTRKLF